MHNFCGEKGEMSDHLFEYFYLFRKDFSFVVNFVKSNKSKNQHDIHKIYSHVIETSPRKSKTLHGIHKIYSHIIEIPPSKSETNMNCTKREKKKRRIE